MERSRLVLFLSVLAVLAPVAIGVQLHRLMAATPPAVDNLVTTNVLTVRKTADAEPVKLDFKAIITEDRNGKPHLYFCRAVLFRVLQIASQRWDDGVFKVQEIKTIRTGWKSPGAGGLLVDILGLPAEKLIRTDDAPTRPDSAVKKAWYEIQFTDGKKITFWATNKILSKKFLELRGRFKGGDETVKPKFMKKRNEAIETLSRLPLKDMYVIE